MKKFYYLLICILCFAQLQNSLSAQNSYMRSTDKIGYNYNVDPEAPVLPEFIPSCEWLNTMRPTGEIKVNTIPAKNGGTGTETDPYIVTTAADLAEIATRVNAGTEAAGTIFPNGNQGYANQYFLMNADIDLSDYNPWIPISIPGQMIFFGHFDGGNHTITHLTTDFSTTNANQGLFSVIGANASVSNLSIKESDIIGGYYTGAFVGACGEGSKVSNCHNYCDVTNQGYYTGGITGASWGTIENCTNDGTHVGTDFIGGIVGDFYGTITGCSNTGDVIGATSLGGIIGYSANVSMNHCSSSDNIYGIYSSGAYCGGVAGFVTNYNSDNTSANCLYFGNVESPSNSSAAIFGRLWTESGVPSHAENNYYDRQMTLKSGVYPGGDVAGTAEGRYTFEMLGEGLQSLLGTGWTYRDGMYPSPENVATTDIAILAAAPSNFDYKSEDDFDQYNSLTADFQLFTGLDVAWTNDHPEILSISNGFVSLMGLGSDILYVSLCDATKRIFVTVTDYTGIETQNYNANVNIYPNPTSDFINIKSDNEILSTSIFNFTGQLVKQQVINGDNTQINVRDLQTGIYFIMLTTNKGEQISKKIVVK